MARSLKKGPFVDQKLFKKVLAQKDTDKKEPVKTWARASMIPPEFVGLTFLVHNGRTHIAVTVREEMVGHRLGEFAPTRTFRGHGKITEKAATKK